MNRVFNVQPIPAAQEPNTLVAKEVDLAETITTNIQRRCDRGDLILHYESGPGWISETEMAGALRSRTDDCHVVLALTQKGNGETWLSDQAGSVCAGGGMPGQGYQAVLVTEAKYWETRVARNGRGAPDELAHALKAEAGQTGLGDAAPMVLTYHVDKERGFSNTDGIQVRETDTSATLTADGDPAEKNDRGLRIVSTEQPAGMVRRLTCTEAERLQSMPDGWTIVTPEEVAYEKKWAALPMEERP